MGGVTSVPQVLGGLITRLLYSLIGANYYSRRLATDKKHNNPLELWRGRDYHVYERYGSVTICSLYFLSIICEFFTSSQYIDDDGDRAHEFWQEELVEDRAVMVRQSRDLKPEGRIAYRVPRLHYDFPAVIMSN